MKVAGFTAAILALPPFAMVSIANGISKKHLVVLAHRHRYPFF
jgi:hypothetical protein